MMVRGLSMRRFQAAQAALNRCAQSRNVCRSMSPALGRIGAGHPVIGRSDRPQPPGMRAASRTDTASWSVRRARAIA